MSIIRSVPALLLVSLVMLTPFQSSLQAQEGRYELGRRLQRFERAWQEASPKERAASTVPMQAAVSAFFSLRWLDAARQLDEASTCFKVPVANDSNYRWCMAQRCVASPMLADISDRQLNISLSPFYSIDAAPDESLRIRFLLRPLLDSDDLFSSGRAPEDDSSSSVLRELDSVPLGGGNWTVELPILNEGDYWLVTEALWDDQRIEVARTIISRTKSLSPRLNNLTTAIDIGKNDGTASGRATLRNCMNLLADVRDGSIQEIDYPAHRLLLDCERLIELRLDSRAYFNQSLSGNVWMALGKEKRTAVCRIYVPKAGDDTPRPVLFLFHGAGGSENMFFETYGAGRTIELANARGWIVVAPRQSLLGGLGMSAEQMVQVLEDHVSIDRQQIFFMGHSMGASQAVNQSVLTPKLPRAVVALGGGGRPGKTTNPTTSWFIGAGDRDFGLRGAQALETSLKANGVDVDLKVYPNVEHMVIVQAALDDVFAFLDRMK